MADGVWIQHPTAASQTCLVELRHIPYLLGYGSGQKCDGRNGRPYIPAPILDCSCGVPHEYKTIHIEVDDVGRALVSAGVLEMIQSAGETGFTVIGHTPTPPVLSIGRPRAAVDFENRKYRPLTPIKETING